MSYAHLIQYERYQIQHWLAAGYSCREIGHRLGRSPSTVCRKRGGGFNYEAQRFNEA